ncbi:hypothetical protein [Kitasatospora sp. NPDC001547]|uniref:hypothetical protein n=1 Tax=Kitasatospora sp. NPDC001547 TaxID=3364015 RepID=UPI00367BECF2
MSVTCPTCTSTDETVAVRQALLDTDRPLDPPTRALLSMPPEPGGTSGVAIALFVLAAVFGLLGLNTLRSDDSGGSPDAAYQAGYHYGAFVLGAVLLGIGLTVHANHRRRRGDTADQWPRSYDQWQRLHQVWRASWLCRRCQVAFLPEAPPRPDSAAPPVTALARFPEWTVTVARQGDGPGAPATSG